MTTISTAAPAADPSFFAGSAKGAALDRDEQNRYQLLACLTGLLFIITYVTSIPPALSLYVPALRTPPSSSAAASTVVSPGARSSSFS